MKNLLLMMLLCVGTVACAQQKTEPVNAFKGCWVVESNVKSPQKQTVKFYNANQQLIYQESYEKKILNFSRKNIRKMLDSALFTVLKNESSTGTLANASNLIKLKH